MHMFNSSYLNVGENFSGDRSRPTRVIRLEDVGNKVDCVGENILAFSEPFVYPDTIREGDILYSMRLLLEDEVDFVNGKPVANCNDKGIPIREDSFYKIEEICKVDLSYKKIYTRISRLYCGITPELFDKSSVETYSL